MKPSHTPPRIFPVGALVICPRPSDPIRDFADVELLVRCRCGRSLQALVGELAARHRVGPDTPMAALIGRLRCTGCRRSFPSPPGQKRPSAPPAAEAVVVVSEHARVSPFPRQGS